jgi:hypothetical protein
MADIKMRWQKSRCDGRAQYAMADYAPYERVEACAHVLDVVKDGVRAHLHQQLLQLRARDAVDAADAIIGNRALV